MLDAESKFRALQQVALTVTSELSVDVVLKKLADAARELAQARYAALGVAREDRKGLSRFITSGISDEGIAAIGDWPRGLGLLGLLLSDPRSVRVSKIQEHPKSIGFPPNHPPMANFLGVPIISKGRILGNFYLTEKIGAEEFTQDDLELIEALSAFAAIAIENARLYSETESQLRQRIQQVQKAEEQLAFLVDLSAMLPTGPLHEEPPLEQVLKRTTTLLGDVCGAVLIGPDGAVTKRVVVHRIPERAQMASDLIDDSWTIIREQVIENDRSILVTDVEAMSSSPLAVEEERMKAGRVSAVLAVPIRSAKQTYGAFISLASQPLGFSQEDLSFAQLAAQRFGTAIENSRLLRELSDALKTRDEFISIATHELKTPVAVLIGYTDVANRSLKSNPDRLPSILEMIKKQSVRLGSLANELLEVSRIHAGRLDLHKERVNLATLVTDAVQRFQAQLNSADQARLRLSVSPADLWGEWDPMRIEQVLVNLLSNAIKYSPSGGDVEVSVDRLDGQARVSVRDHGIGIPTDQQARILEPFFRTTTATQAKIAGAGLGLFISKEIVERHGGRLWFESEEGRGSTFGFAIPFDRGPDTSDE
jgi:signal transduction histidine kinase